MFNNLKRVIELLIDEDEKAVLEYVSIVDHPAIERDFIYFSKKDGLKFKVDNEEKRIVVGPAMIPYMNIPRMDEFTGEVYAVYFTPETISKAAELFLKMDRASSQNTNHERNATKDVYMMESWIKEFKSDKSSEYGFSDLPVGTWFVKMKILDDKIWEQIKKGEFKGFSIEGNFLFGEEHYESLEFSRDAFKHAYKELSTEKERKQMDQIIRLLIIEEGKNG